MKVKTAYKELERHPTRITAISDATVDLATTMQAEMLRIWQSLKHSKSE